MKEALTFAALVFGATMIFFGNDWGFLGLIPALIQTVKDAKTI
jgi:hypothetical protein